MSGDAKAKARVGNLAAGGAELRLCGDPRVAEDHDFAHARAGTCPDGHPEIGGDRMGMAAVPAPYGVFDHADASSHVTIGTSADTSEFAGGAYVRWWFARGRERRPDADELLLTLDGGGSNRAAGFLLERELALACRQTGLRAITVSRCPPGKSRHDAIERHVWAPVSRNRGGKPITSAEEAAAHVAATTTSTGLVAGCEIDWGACLTEAAKERARREAGLPKGPSAEEAFLEIADIEYFHDDPAMRRWNYRIVPR